jgi:hypothetical protein
LLNVLIIYMKLLASHSQSSRRKWPIAALAAADLVVFGATDPHNAPSMVLFAGFLLLATSFYVLLLSALKLFAWYGVSPGRHRKRFIRLSAGVFSGLVALQSIGELSSRDVLVLLPLAIIAYIYVSYGQSQPSAAPVTASAGQP